MLNYGSRVGASEDKGIFEGFAVGIGGEEAGAKGVAGTSGIFYFDVFVEADAINFFAVGCDCALVAVGNDGIWDVIFDFGDELGQDLAFDDFLSFASVEEKNVDVREKA